MRSVTARILDGKAIAAQIRSEVSERVRPLAERGIEVDRRKILVEHPIKYLGEYTIPVKLHRDVTAEIRIQVVREESEPAE